MFGTGDGGAGVAGGTRGSGPGVRAYAEPGARGSALQALTLEANNSSPTIEAHQVGTGHGVYSHIENASNAGRALYGRTGGTGHAVLASIVNTRSVVAAAKATTQGSGPGLEALSAKGVGATFRGKTAQVQLVPSSDAGHPASGAAGAALRRQLEAPVVLPRRHRLAATRLGPGRLTRAAPGAEKKSSRIGRASGSVTVASHHTSSLCTSMVKSKKGQHDCSRRARSRIWSSTPAPSANRNRMPSAVVSRPIGASRKLANSAIRSVKPVRRACTAIGAGADRVVPAARVAFHGSVLRVIAQDSPSTGRRSRSGAGTSRRTRAR